ncbi:MULTISPECIES: precorrin-8X methylmutase [Methanohalophilus]|jgi:precorrin-8X/cobalt-precorrin-8 methylmutase|uniref:Precorrin-8X methylmutase n=1 Tax=Methanohalophilus euhalobius TaxID=51203 RepID=A0A285EZ86_9EURY|nr:MULTISPECIES: precorrin-8X methylmutase [Methanohalophilus]KXS46565.1 MAG: precorrin-8X methylmutase [Methanohalophilus sp. T328-1]RSD35805.1 MAG: precorrin-8X methylmutase [Methanohalophilus sp.]OBZ35964.1 MAG: precorrin-8X methylmutase [Methanohalophilus sp. DAL1]ODV50683.1 MAG: precorrin-8X methylmutase [Methanohalophilus sp. 2-GBenrich]PQV43615.1 precorrin-8X methylmutase [Methanohalophilus euhalobius]
MTTEEQNSLELDKLVEITMEAEPELVEMCRDMGAQTEEAKAIYMTSRRIASKLVGDDSPQGRVRQRCMISTGDPEVAEIMRFTNDPIKAGVEAIKNGAPIFVDINMVKAGITKKGHDCPVICVLDEDKDAEIAHKYGITRTAAGFLNCRDRLEGAIVAIGNAPSAAFAVCRMIDHGIKPALVIGTPVGFVNSAESKEEVRKRDIPSITCVGTRGGTPIAVACVNEIVAIKRDEETCD